MQVVRSEYQDDVQADCLAVIREVAEREARGDAAHVRLLSSRSATSSPYPGRDGEHAAALEDVVIVQQVPARHEETYRSDEFFVVALHELRNVTASLCGYVEMLSACVPPSGRPALTRGQIETIEEVEHAAGSLADLTDHLADIMRMQSGRFEMHRQVGDLVALVRRVAKRLQVTTHRHDLVISASAESILAQMDIRRIEQVLTNVIGNAIKYSPDGGRIVMTVRKDLGSGQAFVSVRDHGIGIPQDQHERVFQRFGRADNARALGVEGSGLGLYLCREIVEWHGGKIWFRPGTGGGTTFYISLPVLTGARAAQPYR